MNEKLPIPPGITDIIPKDDLGTTPAKCFRDTGEIWTNNKIWPRLDDPTKCFILGHEAGHINLNTSDEFACDRWAFDWCMQNKMGLSKMVHALTKVLSYPEDKPMQKAEQEARTLEMTRLCLEYDWKVNGNEKAKQELMQMKAYTPEEMESYLGVISRNKGNFTPRKPSITPRFTAPSRSLAKPRSTPLYSTPAPAFTPAPVSTAPASNLLAVQGRGGSAGDQPTPRSYINSTPFAPEQLEQIFASGQDPEMLQRADLTGDVPEADSANREKILGMEKKWFFTALGALLAIVVIILTITLSKKKSS